MRYVYILSLLVFHPMLVLLSALCTAITAVAGSGHVTWMAYSDHTFTMWGYWVVSAAVVTTGLAFIKALRGKADVDNAPPLMPEIWAMFA